VIYGRQAQPQSLEVTSKDLENLIHHSASEKHPRRSGRQRRRRPKRLALVQEIQHHVLSGQVLHVDFHEVSENEKVTVLVPWKAWANRRCQDRRGVLEHVLFKLKVRALPKDLPEVISVDVTSWKSAARFTWRHCGADGSGDSRRQTYFVLAVAAPVTEAEEAARRRRRPKARRPNRR